MTRFFLVFLFNKDIINAFIINVLHCFLYVCDEAF